MYAPILEIDTRKVTENARRLHDFCADRGVELAFVTKGFSARPEVIRAAQAGGITRFADSRLKNIAAAKAANVDHFIRTLPGPAACPPRSPAGPPWTRRRTWSAGRTAASRARLR